MARPKNKGELQQQVELTYSKLFALIDSLSEKEQESEFPEGTLNRNIRDVLAHLHHWQLLMLDWYKIGMQGEKPKMPAPGYSWKTTPELNILIQQKYSSTPLKKVRKLLDDSHSKLQVLISNQTDEELFTKKKLNWTGSTSLGAYLISSTSSHYDWAIKLIKRIRK